MLLSKNSFVTYMSLVLPDSLHNFSSYKQGSVLVSHSTYTLMIVP